MPGTFGTRVSWRLVYKLKKMVGANNFSAQFIKIVSDYKKIGYNINVLRQTTCLVGYFMQTKHLYILIHIRIKGVVGSVKHV